MNSFQRMFQGFGMGDAQNPGIMQSLTGQTAPQWLGLAPQGQANVYTDTNSPMPQPAGMLSQTATPPAPAAPTGGEGSGGMNPMVLGLIGSLMNGGSNPFEGTGISPYTLGLGGGLLGGKW